MMIAIILVSGFVLMVLERLVPDQKLPEVKGWWLRVILINVFQLGVVFLGAWTWDKWLAGAKVFHLGESFSPFVGGLITYFILTFVYYWWHRWRHDINFLWLTMHQVHHSPQRIETITSFFKHPLEIVANSLITGAVTYVLLGMPVEAAAWSMVFQAWGEFFYHMNIKTPRWVGYFFQRPEMHRIHHERGKHYSNFSDLPIWDMMFGTYKNPDTYQGLCGFKPEREARLGAMLAFQNVNNPYPPKSVEGDK